MYDKGAILFLNSLTFLCIHYSKSVALPGAGFTSLKSWFKNWDYL